MDDWKERLQNVSQWKDMYEASWKERLQKAFQEKAEEDVLLAQREAEIDAFMLSVVTPALAEVGEVLRVHGRQLKHQRTRGRVTVTVINARGSREFTYTFTCTPTVTGVTHEFAAAYWAEDEPIDASGILLTREGAPAPLSSITKEAISHNFVSHYIHSVRGLRRS